VSTKTHAKDWLNNLKKTLDSDEIWVKMEAITKIAQIDTPEAYTILLQALKDNEPQVRIKAIQAISKFKRKGGANKIARLLKDENTLVRRRAALTLGEIKEAKPILLDLLEYGSKVEKRYAAIALGAAKGKDTYSHLLKALDSENYEVRCGAVEGLGQMRERKATKPIIRCLKDDSPEVRIRAVDVLGILNDTRAVEPLIEAVRDPDKNVRWRAVYVLGHYSESGNQIAEDAIIKALEDEDWNVRRMAVLELRHGDDKVFTALMKRLKDKSKFVRRYAAYSLGRLGALKAVPDLVELLNDPELEVRDQARWALKKLGKQQLK